MSYSDKPKGDLSLLTTDDPDPQHNPCLILIDEDRYSGAYSDHGYTAWINAIPNDASAGDPDCKAFWQENKTVFGGGSTPDEAVADLFQKIFKDHDYDPTPYPRAIWNTSIYDGKPDPTLEFVGCKNDPRFQQVYPKSYAIYNKTW